MKDRFGRDITYLRISVTDRCNLRCVYCMPEEGIPALSHDQILRFEEIAEVAKQAVSMGVFKIRLTGGEPLVRRGVPALTRMLRGIPGVRDLAMTTNGILLGEFAQQLADAGLMRVNVSLDALRPERYAEITRGGDVRQVLAGIEAAQKTGLSPVKLNCVVSESPDEPDAREVLEFGRERGLEVRFIKKMDSATGKFSVVIGGSGGDCLRCNRIRLSANGLVRPCLFADIGFSVRELGAKEALLCAIRQKPEAGGPCSHNWIRATGG
jgi:cyclic pyranopterin phosphate synthase